MLQGRFLFHGFIIGSERFHSRAGRKGRGGKREKRAEHIELDNLWCKVACLMFPSASHPGSRAQLPHPQLQLDTEKGF